MEYLLLWASQVSYADETKCVIKKAWTFQEKQLLAEKTDDNLVGFELLMRLPAFDRMFCSIKIFDLGPIPQTWGNALWNDARRASRMYGDLPKRNYLTLIKLHTIRFALVNVYFLNNNGISEPTVSDWILTGEGTWVQLEAEGRRERPVQVCCHVRISDLVAKKITQ